MFGNLVCCADCACGAHSDMAAFVSVLVGILFCTTFWDKPRRLALSFIRKEAKKHVADFRAKVLSDPETASVCSDTTWVNLDSFANKQVENVRLAVTGPIAKLYVFLALLSGCLGMAELFFSKTTYYGTKNVWLLLPIGVYLGLSVVVYLWMRKNIWFKKRSYKQHFDIKKEESRISENEKEVNNLVPEPPPSKTKE